MSRVAKSPVVVPNTIVLEIKEQTIVMKKDNRSLSLTLRDDVAVSHTNDTLVCEPKTPTSWAQAGTTRANLANMVKGLTEGFRIELALVGVGYRAKVAGKTLNLTLGFSHPVNYAIPEGIQIETPSATEIVISGIDKQRVGQVAAEIRAYRPPEPYKGKGIRYKGEKIKLKEGKSK